jgi:hypothetical protein
MKETIEWFKTIDSVSPIDGTSILMKLSDEVDDVWAGSFNFWDGFRLAGGEVVEPIMWCYFPKGTQ